MSRGRSPRPLPLAGTFIKKADDGFHVAVRQREQPRDRLTLRERPRHLRHFLSEAAGIKLARLKAESGGEAGNRLGVRLSRRSAFQVGEAGDGDPCLSRQLLLRPSALVAELTNQSSEVR